MLGAIIFLFLLFVVLGVVSIVSGSANKPDIELFFGVAAFVVFVCFIYQVCFVLDVYYMSKGFDCGKE
jgi:hypothetical protein